MPLCDDYNCTEWLIELMNVKYAILKELIQIAPRRPLIVFLEKGLPLT